METVKISDDNRFNLARFTVIGEPTIHPFYILNVYAPANNNNNCRFNFFNQVMEYLHGMESDLGVLENLILMGDFNFSYEIDQRARQPIEFVTFTSSFFNDCINTWGDDDNYLLPTYSQPSSNARSCIDYIFAPICTMARSNFCNPHGLIMLY